MKLPEPCLVTFRKSLRDQIRFKIRITCIGSRKTDVIRSHIARHLRSGTAAEPNLIPDHPIASVLLTQYGHRSAVRQFVYHGKIGSRATPHIQRGRVDNRLPLHIREAYDPRKDSASAYAVYRHEQGKNDRCAPPDSVLLHPMISCCQAAPIKCQCDTS